MSIFLVTPLANNAAVLGAAIAEKFSAEDFYTLVNNAGWFVDYKGTTVELSAHIGISGQPPEEVKLGSALVVPFTTYFGRGSADMWEWLKTRFERS